MASAYTPGQVYWFTRSGSTWTQQKILSSCSSNVGYEVAISGSLAGATRIYTKTSTGAWLRDLVNGSGCP